MNHLSCVEKLLGNSSLSSDQSIIDSVHYIQSHEQEFQEKHSNFTKLQMDYFFQTSIPCILNITNDNLESSEPAKIEVLLAQLKLHCVGIYCLHEDKCNDAELDSIIFGIMMIISITMMIFTCMLRKRRTCCVWCCWGRPGPVIPLNMLDATDNRRGIALTFGLTATKCIYALFGNYDRLFGKEAAEVINSWPSYASVFVKFVCTILISQLAYPFLICQHMRNKLIGAIIGLLLCITWFTLKMIKVAVISKRCVDLSVFLGSGRDFGTLRFIMDLPFYVCLVLLAIKFGYIIYTALKKSWENRDAGEIIHWTDDTDWKTKYTYKHVRDLFRVQVEEDIKVLDDENDTFIQKTKRTLASKLYASDYDFRYSTRMLSSFLVAFLVVVNIAAVIFTVGNVVGDAFSSARKDSLSQLLGQDIDVIYYYIDGFKVSWTIAGVGAIIFSTVVLIHSLALYRSHYLKLRRGDRSFLPESMRSTTEDCPGALMNASMRSAGYQVGYSAWGFIINFAVLFLICVLVHTQIICAIRFKKNTIAVSLFLSLWPTLLVTVVMIIAQKFISSMCFLRDPDTLAVDNRRAYHIFVYYTFFFNIFLGLISCLLRILYGILFGFIFLQRLQKSTLPYAYQELDSGYFAYMSYLLVEHQHANLVLRVFTSFLLQSQDLATEWKIDDIYGEDSVLSSNQLIKKEFGSSSCSLKELKEHRLKKKRAVIRWHLYVLLLGNPSLRKYRKSYRKQKFNMRMNAELLNTYKPNSKCKEEKHCANDVVEEVEHDDSRQGVVSEIEESTRPLEEAIAAEFAEEDTSSTKILLTDLSTSPSDNNDSITMETVRHPNATTDIADETYITGSHAGNESNISFQTENGNVITNGTKSQNKIPNVEFV